jgi:predicted small lipoprotein YifL
VIRKLSLLLTIVVALGLALALSRCGKKGSLEPPPKEKAALQIETHAA